MKDHCWSIRRSLISGNGFSSLIGIPWLSGFTKSLMWGSPWWTMILLRESSILIWLITVWPINSKINSRVGRRIRIKDKVQRNLLMGRLIHLRMKMMMMKFLKIFGHFKISRLSLKKISLKSIQIKITYTKRLFFNK